jgi:hypothetical protein
MAVSNPVIHEDEPMPRQPMLGAHEIPGTADFPDEDDEPREPTIAWPPVPGYSSGGEKMNCLGYSSRGTRARGKNGFSIGIKNRNS